MGMNVKNETIILILLAVAVFLGSCGPMDTLLPSAGNYKVNIQINGIPLNERSFASSNDAIRPFFEEPVSDDPDVTDLMVFLRNSRGDVVGWRVIYRLDEDEEDSNQETDFFPGDDQSELEQDETDIEANSTGNNKKEDNINIVNANNNNESNNKVNDKENNNNESNIKINNDNNAEQIETEDNNEPDQDLNVPADTTTETTVPSTETTPSTSTETTTVTTTAPTVTQTTSATTTTTTVTQTTATTEVTPVLTPTVTPAETTTVETPDDFKHGDELIILVKSLDDKLPLFPMPSGLPMGRYTLVAQVMSGRNILQRMEKQFFYLSDNHFSYQGIDIHLPGIAENTQLIPRSTTIMLETVLDFDKNLDPYIVWYNGRRRVHEGKFSDGAGNFFWRAPDESGFFSFRAEVFPVDATQGLAGYVKDISLLVASKPVDIHLISENVTSLEYWYVFEANLNDSRGEASAVRSLRHLRNSPKWRASNGTYGVVTGHDNILTLPRVMISDNDKWQTLFRVKHLNDGGILSVLFGSAQNTFLHLSIENRNLVLTLSSPLETSSQVFNLSTVAIASIEAESQNTNEFFVVNPNEEDTAETSLLSASFANVNQDWVVEEAFLTAGVIFSLNDGVLSAKINIVNQFIDFEAELNPVSIEVEVENEFQIQLGFSRDNNVSIDGLSDSVQQVRRVRHEFVTLWDEFALLSKPITEILTANIQQETDEEQLNSGDEDFIDDDEYLDTVINFESEFLQGVLQEFLQEALPEDLPEGETEVISVDLSI